jgi:hypothetical protein
MVRNHLFRFAHQKLATGVAARTSLLRTFNKASRDTSVGSSYRYYSASGKSSLAWNVLHSIILTFLNSLFLSFASCTLICSVASGIRSAETVPITYVDADGIETTVDAEIGKNLLDAAHDNNVELEGTCGVGVGVGGVCGVKRQTKQSLRCYSAEVAGD